MVVTVCTTALRSWPYGVMWVSGVEIWLHSFITLELDGSEWLNSGPARFTSGKDLGTHCTGGWLGPRVGLDVLKK
jgi:hypothetical protein